MSFKLSKTSIALMEECPRCFWLTQHGVWKRPQGITMSLPMGMDHTIKRHFDKFRKKGILPPELNGHEHCPDMKLFDDEELLKIWRNNFKGIRYEDKEGNVLFGAVDDILQKGKKLIVLDYKTRGFPLKEDTHEFYQNQLDIYNFLLRKNGYEIEDYGLLLFYYPKDILETGEIIFDTHLKKMKIDIKKAEELFQSAIKLLNEDCPTKTCEWCDGK